MKAMKTLGVSVLVLTLAGSALAFGGQNRGAMAELTDEQRQQVQEILQDHRERNEPIRDAQQAALEAELRTVLTDEQIEAMRPRARGPMAMFAGLELTDEQKAQIAELRGQRPESREAMHAALAEILTDEQITQLEERREHMQERRGGKGRNGY
ncbi:Spy/CpxP family protein refolding chaperone [Salinibius halmophilus]|uniref:Spy/CpxP family protein refolding chaperone n=1 Tax=Salinibius halmophilus TaxID=1853216 RepID=UPI000E665624|nr:hypothetical protein [Salinibius halmophilus]